MPVSANTGSLILPPSRRPFIDLKRRMPLISFPLTRTSKLVSMKIFKSISQNYSNKQPQDHLTNFQAFSLVVSKSRKRLAMSLFVESYTICNDWTCCILSFMRQVSYVSFCWLLQHQFDSVELVDFTCTRVIINGYDIGFRMLMAQFLDNTFANDMIRQEPNGCVQTMFGAPLWISSIISPVRNHPSPV